MKKVTQKRSEVSHGEIIDGETIEKSMSEKKLERELDELDEIMVEMSDDDDQIIGRIVINVYGDADEESLSSEEVDQIGDVLINMEEIDDFAKVVDSIFGRELPVEVTRRLVVEAGKRDIDDPESFWPLTPSSGAGTRPKLYWVWTDDHDEDWFVVATSGRQARRFFESYEGFDPGDARSRLVLRDIAPCDREPPSHPSYEFLIACGGEFLNDEPGPRAVRIGGRIYAEGMLDSEIRSMNDDIFEAQGKGRLNETSPRIKGQDV